MKIAFCLFLFSGWATLQSVAASSSVKCSALCGEQHVRCVAACMSSSNHLERRHGERPNSPQFGSRRGANVKTNATARKQDELDSKTNARGKQPAGGVGGIDPATGESLFALPDPSQFCKGSKQTLADGTQRETGYCSSLPQGQVPSVDRMVSTLILEPRNEAFLEVGAAFNVKIQTRNMKTGFFTVAASEYYTQPQTLSSRGKVKGHQHITIQRLTSLTKAPNANEQVFFKGVNDAAGRKGISVVPVPAGTLTTPGIYRICSMSGSFSHQPVIMPIAQRGAQDDCIRINVGKSAGKAGDKGGKRGDKSGKHGGKGEKHGDKGGKRGGESKQMPRERRSGKGSM